MSVIYLVQALFDHLGSTPVRAFSDKYDAEVFAETCSAYECTRPVFPEEGSSENTINAWGAQMKEWDSKNPAGDVGTPDGFNVTVVPFGMPT